MLPKKVILRIYLPLAIFGVMNLQKELAEEVISLEIMPLLEEPFLINSKEKIQQ